MTMSTEIKLPVLAEGIEAADVLNVLVKEGDVAAADDPVIELESEKATVSVPAQVPGRVVKILVKAGQKVKVGDPILVIEESGNEAAPNASLPQEASEAHESLDPLNLAKNLEMWDETIPDKAISAPLQTVEVKMPVLADGVESGDILNVLVKEGDTIAPDDPLVELESEKATVSVPSPVGGKVIKVLVKAGEKVRVGETIVVLGTEKAGNTIPPEPPASPLPAETKPEAAPASQEIRAVAEPVSPVVQPLAPAVTTDDDFIPASPAVRRIAREIGLDLRRVKGSGKNGRILIEDLDPYIEEYVRKRAGGVTGIAVTQPELPDFSQWGPVRKVKIDSLRRKISEHLSMAWQTIPHVHQFHEADITDLIALQKRHRERVKQLGGNLTLTPFLMKAAVVALKEFPEFNATFDVRNDEIVYKEYYHLGIAVDTPAGLIVPVIRDVDKKTIVELAVELTEVAQRTRERKVSLEELRGSTFTISNLGGIGGLHFTPIINSPEVAILGVGRATTRPALKDGTIIERSFLPLCLGYDHRIIDGAQGARFIVRLVEILENFEATFLGF